MVQAQTTASHTLTDRPKLLAKWDGFRITEMVAKELVGFLVTGVLAFFFLVALAMTLASLVLVVSNGSVDICGRMLEPAIAISMSLFAYTIHVCRSDHRNRLYRVAIQWLIWTLGMLLLVALGICSSSFFVTKAAVDAAVISLALICGMLWVRPKPDLPRDILGFLDDKELARLAKSGEILPEEIRREQTKRLGMHVVLTLLSLPLFALFLTLLLSVSEQLVVPAQQIRYVGKPVPDFAFSTIDGEDWSLKSRQGSVVVLDVWRRFDAENEQQTVLWSELSEKYASRDLIIATVSVESAKQTQAWSQKFEVDWPVVMHADSKSLFSPDTLGGPASMAVVDRDGIVTLVSKDATEIREEIDRLMSE